MTIVEFLLARIAEDEAVARDATPGHWYADDVYGTVTAAPFTSAREAYDRVGTEVDCWVISESMDSGVESRNLAHIARHNPIRTLAECEAKRRIVDNATNMHTSGPDWNEACCILAAVYADHPDYREEWRP